VIPLTRWIPRCRDSSSRNQARSYSFIDLLILSGYAVEFAVSVRFAGREHCHFPLSRSSLAWYYTISKARIPEDFKPQVNDDTPPHPSIIDALAPRIIWTLSVRSSTSRCLSLPPKIVQGFLIHRQTLYNLFNCSHLIRGHPSHRSRPLSPFNNRIFHTRKLSIHSRKQPAPVLSHEIVLLLLRSPRRTRISSSFRKPRIPPIPLIPPTLSIHRIHLRYTMLPSLTLIVSVQRPSIPRLLQTLIRLWKSPR
jgi:hypothetical protein